MILQYHLSDNSPRKNEFPTGTIVCVCGRGLMTIDEKLTFCVSGFLPVLSCEYNALNEEEDTEHCRDGDIGPPCLVKS